MIVALLSCCLLITAGTDGQQAGDVEIENCSAGFIDIQENANNTIKCTGYNGRDTIVWTFKRTGENISKAVATCDPSSNCTVHQPDHFAVERSPSHSTLFYQQYDRQVDKDTIVACRSQFQGSSRSKSCRLNVINPAELSNCTIEEDRDNGTVRGSCRFDHAYSHSRGFSCTWYQEKDGQSKPLSGDIMYGSGSGGVCTFTSTDLDRDPGTVTYIINFYPGPGNITVNVGNIDTKTRKSTDRTIQDTSPKTQEENDLPMGAIVGGIVSVVVIIVVVVVVVVFVRRKRKQKTAGSTLGSGNVNATESEDFEEHVTPVVFNSDGPDASQENDENTYEIPAHRPSNAEPEHVYNVSNTAATTTTTTTTTPSYSIATTTGDLHNTTTNPHRGQGKTLDNVHHNPVYVNENQPGEKSSGVQQNPTYANDYPETAQGYVDANRDSNPYYSEIKDTGIN